MKEKYNKPISKIIQKKQRYREKNQISLTKSARRTKRFSFDSGYYAIPDKIKLTNYQSGSKIEIFDQYLMKNVRSTEVLIGDI